MQSILLHNEDYFKYVFKKTEKIVSAVFYTTRNLDTNVKKDTLIVSIEDKSKTLLETAERSLTASTHNQRIYTDELAVALVALESLLSVATAAHLIGEDLLEVFKHEFVTLHKSLREYAVIHLKSPFGVGGEDSAPRLRPRGTVRPQREKAGMVGLPGALPQATDDRSTRILAVIKDKGETSIKDISATVTDVSEKTIQRELMSLIEKGQIVKDGERRWSRYRIV